MSNLNNTEGKGQPNILWPFSSNQEYASHVPMAISNAGGNPIAFDYINEFDVKTNDIKYAKQYNLEGLTNDEIAHALINPAGNTRSYFIKMLREKSDEKLREVLEEYIDKHDIQGIFLPGDYYNYDTAPYHPEPQERPRYSKILLQIAKERKIPLMGVCGGLQSIAYSEGINIKRVKDMVSENVARNHVLSETHTDTSETFLSQNSREELVMPNTKLGNYLQELNDKLGFSSDGEQYLYVPEAHGGAIDNSWTNRVHLENLGYKVNIVSPDGIVQGIEHKDYQICAFQGHPEALAARKEPISLNLLKRFLVDPARERMQQVSAKEAYDTSSLTMVDRLKLQEEKANNMAPGI